MITDFASLRRHSTGFPLSYILRNNVKVTLADFTEESISAKSTFDNTIIEIDTRLYQYSCADLIKWQGRKVKYWHRHENYHPDQHDMKIIIQTS